MYQTGFTGSAAKLNFTNNVTSDIQTQINAAKVPYTGIGTIIFQGGIATSTTLSENGWYLICFRRLNNSQFFPTGAPMYLFASTKISYKNSEPDTTSIKCFATVNFPRTSAVLQIPTIVTGTASPGVVELVVFRMEK